MMKFERGIELEDKLPFRRRGSRRGVPSSDWQSAPTIRRRNEDFVGDVRDLTLVSDEDRDIRPFEASGWSFAMFRGTKKSRM